MKEIDPMVLTRTDYFILAHSHQAICVGLKFSNSRTIELAIPKTNCQLEMWTSKTIHLSTSIISISLVYFEIQSLNIFYQYF